LLIKIHCRIRMIRISEKARYGGAPVIPATQEAEKGRAWFKASLGKS
jgi:hypothetical protein